MASSSTVLAAIRKQCLAMLRLAYGTSPRRSQLYKSTAGRCNGAVPF